MCHAKKKNLQGIKVCTQGVESHAGQRTKSMNREQSCTITIEVLCCKTM